MMHVHLVFVTKYRRARFSADQFGFLKDIFESVCKDFNAELVEMNGEQNHVHLLVNYPPTVSVSTLVISLNGVSSRMIRKQSQTRFERGFGSCLWSPSYFAAICGGAPLSMIKTYIENRRRLINLKLRGFYLRPKGRSFTPKLGKYQAITVRYFQP